MTNFLKLFDKLLNKYSCWFFIVLTFIYAILRVPFFDEAYAYMISQLSIKEIFMLIPIEGHPFIWYLLLKIFCSNLNLYPYPMLILNWFLFSIAIYFFWKKAPFNNLIKFLIIFSYPFVNYYAIFARPYGLSILMLFLLAVFYDKCVKRPYLYISLILICINVSAVSAFGAGAFGILFAYKLFKENTDKKKTVIVFVSLVFGMILSVLQFLNLEMLTIYKIADIKTICLNFIYPLFNEGLPRTVFNITRIMLVFYVPYLFFKRCKEGLFFILFTYLFMAYLFTQIYPASYWHFCFYFVYLIIALWISWDYIKNDRFLNTVLILFLFALVFPSSLHAKEKIQIFSNLRYEEYIEQIKTINNENKSKFFSLDWYSPVSSGIIPYLKKDNIFLYDANNFRKDTFDSMKNTYRYKTEKFNGEEFIKYLDSDKQNYLLTAGYFFYHTGNDKIFRYVGQNFYYKDLIFFKRIYQDTENNYLIFKIEKLQSK